MRRDVFDALRLTYAQAVTFGDLAYISATVGTRSAALFAALDAGYGALRAVFDLPSLPSGPLYGLGLYAANLLGIGPALDITRGPANERPTTVGRRLMLHAFYGTATALVADRARAALR